MPRQVCVEEQRAVADCYGRAGRERVLECEQFVRAFASCIHRAQLVRLYLSLYSILFSSLDDCLTITEFKFFIELITFTNYTLNIRAYFFEYIIISSSTLYFMSFVLNTYSI